MKNYDFTHDGENWKLTQQGAERASKVFDSLSKQKAVRKAAAFMQSHPGSMKIHKLDGRIQEERTYPRSEDPRQSRG